MTVEEGKEYWFLNCYLLDETYFSNAKAQGFDTKDPTLRMADAITGYAARSFVPAEDGRCTVFREFFTEEQLADPANVVTSIPNTQFVTVDEAFWRTRLLKLMGELDFFNPTERRTAMSGKKKCKILREIRQKIADENDIPFVTEECRFKGQPL